ncbi:Gfo/Idh/MocA family oxidoreductase [Adhaeribacter radiodurans]|uniref:Gfo/Idh/MocA family oxidoreductase n=1 Tax=Adhaeribacter radiodurans TaxID=2745197 RepID=A0A7L7LF12_9BACT|nr:Gfo/Idh/MocA family oxidoreductase [Adhaeribacter radiodurans]QMU31347.1 Gfo/Idh/MocA family oxidoreductase [Adhaeribacter radiodurans]
MEDQQNTSEQSKNAFNRRDFIKGAALTAASFYIFPRHVLGGPGFVAPSDKFNIAGVGVGGMGRSNLLNLSSQNIVALCDVDWDFAGKAFDRLTSDAEKAQARLKDAATDKDRQNITNQINNFNQLKAQYPKAKRFKDYREMLDKMSKDIDGVVVATPDHTHAVIAMEAMRRKKHVYVQKPLTYTVHEARALAEAARKYKVITQMGNQGHSSEGARLINEWIWDGAIGKVSTVYAWTNRPIWPQGIPRPTETIATPEGLDWEVFLGPAPLRPYNPAYHPFKWRGWVDYGASALGDMGAHLLDHPNWALKLGAPVSVEATSTPFGGGNNKQDLATYPSGSMVTYEFAARENMPPVTLTWFDGGLMPPKPTEMGPDENMDKSGGVLMIGDKGKLMHETYGSNPRLLPASRMAEYKQPAKTIPRIDVSHEMDWVRCAKDGKKQPSSNFDYAGPLTETMLLGIIATRFTGKKLLWDSAKMQFTNAPEANPFVTREYRSGWSLTA